MDQHVPATGTLDPDKLVRNRGQMQHRLDDPLENEVRQRCQNKLYQQFLNAAATAKAQVKAEVQAQAEAKREEQVRRKPGTEQTEGENKIEPMKAISMKINPGAMFRSVKEKMGTAFPGGIKGFNPAAAAASFIRGSAAGSSRAPGWAKLGFVGGGGGGGGFLAGRVPLIH
ncbi:MAG: hypothetical protein M1823_004969 [Watsoniomyces obsoletus]|nr:MAG: hypothetical protein M1823_004969 [Watsoniomyces obsoletus]